MVRRTGKRPAAGQASATSTTTAATPVGSRQVTARRSCDVGRREPRDCVLDAINARVGEAFWAPYRCYELKSRRTLPNIFTYILRYMAGTQPFPFRTREAENKMPTASRTPTLRSSPSPVRYECQPDVPLEYVRGTRSPQVIFIWSDNLPLAEAKRASYGLLEQLKSRERKLTIN